MTHIPLGSLCIYKSKHGHAQGQGQGQMFRIYKIRDIDLAGGGWLGYDTIYKPDGFMFIFIGPGDKTATGILLGRPGARTGAIPHAYQILTAEGLCYVIDYPHDPYIECVEGM